MITGLNELRRFARETVHVAIGIAAVSIYDSSASDTAYDKATNLAPVVIARGDSVAVCVNSNGFILVSSRGSSWSPAFASVVRFRGVAYGGGRFVAVGHAGVIASSSNWIDWTQIPPPLGPSLYAVVFGNNRFVAVGNEGAILSSSDGLRWKSVDVTDTRLRGITFGNGAFVAVGHEGLILSSTDGSHWRVEASGSTERLLSVAFGNGRFVAVGWHGTIVAGERERWRLAHLPGQPRLIRVVFQANAFQTFSEHGLSITSVDGENWDPLEITAGQDCDALAFATKP